MLELMKEKRSTTRVKAIHDVLRLLQRRPPGADPGLAAVVRRTHLETLTNQLLSSVKKGTPVEQVQACKALGTMALFAGADNHELYRSCCPSGGTLQTAALEDRCIPVRAAALRAISMLSFVCATDHSATAESIGVCVDVLARLRSTEAFFSRQPGAAARVGCWRGWRGRGREGERERGREGGRGRDAHVLEGERSSGWSPVAVTTYSAASPASLELQWH